MHKLNIKLKRNKIKIKIIILTFIMILKRNFFIVNKCKIYIKINNIYIYYNFFSYPFVYVSIL